MDRLPPPPQYFSRFLPPTLPLQGIKPFEASFRTYARSRQEGQEGQERQEGKHRKDRKDGGHRKDRNKENKNKNNGRTSCRRCLQVQMVVPSLSSRNLHSFALDISAVLLCCYVAFRCKVAPRTMHCPHSANMALTPKAKTGRASFCFPRRSCQMRFMKLTRAVPHTGSARAVPHNAKAKQHLSKVATCPRATDPSPRAS